MDGICDAVKEKIMNVSYVTVQKSSRPDALHPGI